MTTTYVAMYGDHDHALHDGDDVDDAIYGFDATLISVDPTHRCGHEVIIECDPDDEEAIVALLADLGYATETEAA